MPEAAAQAPDSGNLQLKLSYDLRSAPAQSGPQSRFIPLEVSINGARAGNWVLMERDGVLYAPLDAFEEWRLNRDSRAPALSYRDQAWYPLSSLPGFTARFNPAEQSLQLNFTAGAFATTRVGQPADERPAVPHPNHTRHIRELPALATGTPAR